MTRLIKVLPIFLILLLCSCEKETTTFQPTESSTQSNVTLSGIVTDESDEPIEGVVAIYKGISSTTNSAGIYEFRDVLVDSKHNTIQISKDGYFETNRTFRTKRADQLIHETQLIEKNFDNSFTTDIGGRVTKDNVTVEFIANTIMYADSKEDFDGVVNVAVHFLDPTDENIAKKMPGDLSALDAEDVLQKSTTYGMAYVELESASGEKLQIKEGSVATLSIEVPDDLLEFAPDKVTASHFSPVSGLWEDETTATLVGGKYFGEVSHFSCWSYNSSAPSIVLTGRVVDELGDPVPGVSIQITPQGEWQGSYGTTDESGIFTGAVQKDTPLKMYIRSVDYCPNNNAALISQDIGPYSEDVNIGDINVDLSNFQTITVNASFFNCDGEPVTNGIVNVARSYFKITDGILNVTVPVCNELTNYVMWAQDLDSGRTTGRLPLVVGQVNNYEDQTICETETPFVEIIAADLGINENTNLEIIANPFGGENKYISALYRNEDGKIIEFRLDFNDGNPNGFSEGTWAVASGFLDRSEFPDPNVRLFTAAADDGQVVIEEVGTDELGNFIKGYYTVNFTQETTGDVYEFTGKFKL